MAATKPLNPLFDPTQDINTLDLNHVVGHLESDEVVGRGFLKAGTVRKITGTGLQSDLNAVLTQTGDGVRFKDSNFNNIMRELDAHERVSARPRGVPTLTPDQLKRHGRKAYEHLDATSKKLNKIQADFEKSQEAAYKAVDIFHDQHVGNIEQHLASASGTAKNFEIGKISTDRGTNDLIARMTGKKVGDKVTRDELETVIEKFGDHHAKSTEKLTSIFAEDAEKFNKISGHVNDHIAKVGRITGVEAKGVAETAKTLDAAKGATSKVNFFAQHVGQPWTAAEPWKKGLIAVGVVATGKGLVDMAQVITGGKATNPDGTPKEITPSKLPIALAEIAGGLGAAAYGLGKFAR